ncbi:MAG TPA: hypothetical protein VFI31_09320 [Pirellulales bacterium]|nr:hypothetical protein [Pirellulales bacterium]
MKRGLDVGLVRRLRGVLRLAEAAAEAEASEVDHWQYAVPVDVLRRQAGLTDADLRWLVNEGFAEHRVETTRPSAKKRSFRSSGLFSAAARVGCVLSPAGARLATKICDVISARGSAGFLKPEWDPATGDWTWDRALVKRLPVNADAQRKILDQCHKVEWAEEIESPFADMPPKRRSRHLSRVLNHLNNGQRDARIHFSAVKKGRCFRWQIIDRG